MCKIPHEFVRIMWQKHLGDMIGNVVALIQDLIDAKVEPKALWDPLERLLKTSLQPC